MSRLFFVLFTIQGIVSIAQSVQPSDLTNLSLWLRAENGVTHSANAVSNWLDFSGANNNCSQNSTANRPLLVNNVDQLAGKSVIRFDGTNDFLNGTTISNINNSSFTIFVIANGESQSSSIASLFSINTAATGFYFTRRPSLNRFSVFNSNTSINSNGSFPSTGYNYRLVTGIKSLGSSFSLKVNGSQDFNSTLTGLTSSFTNAIYQIGAGNSSNFFRGDIAEVIIYTRELTSVEITQIENYLMNKYAPPVNLGVDVNDTYGFEDLTLSTSGFFSSYLWQTPSGNFNTPTITVNNPGQYQLTAIDIFGRVSTDTIVVSRPYYDIIQLSNQVICHNENTLITAPMPVGDYQFVQWSDGVTTQTRTINQTVSLSYTIKDNSNFTRTSNVATYSFDNSLQNIRLGNDTTLCFGNTIGLAVTSPSINSYLWSTASTGTTATVTTTGEYSVTVTNANNCQKRDTIFVTIAGESPTVQALIANSVCVGSELNYSHISSVYGGTIANVLWNFGDNTSSTSDAGTKVYTQVGTYNGMLLVTTDGGCQTQVPFQVVVRNKPLVNFSVPIFCTGQPVNITNTSSIQSGGGSLQNYNWLVDGQSVASSQSLLFTFPNNGDYLVKLIVTDVNSCVDSTTQVVTAGNSFPIPQAPILNTPVPNVTLAVGQAQTFQWSSVPNTTAYIFEVSTQANFTSLHFQTSTTSTSFSYTPSITGNLFWRVRTVNLCQLGGTSEVRAYTTIDLGTGISMWLRADAGVTTVSNAVSQWVDQSGMGLNVSQATTGNRPTLVNNVASLNNRPAISFNGTSNFLTSSMNSGLANSSLTVFVIGSGGSQSTANAVYYGIGSVSSGFWLTRRASSSRIGAYNNNQLVQGTLTNLPTSGYDFRLFGVRKSLGNALQIKVNGTNEIISTNSVAIGSFTDANIQVGAGNGASFLNGQIAEVLVYNRDLSDLELSQVEKYLMDKYAPPVNIGADINDIYGFENITLSSVGYFINYAWSGATTASTPTILINNPGQYILEATDIFGRVSRDTINITRPDYATVQLTNQTFCYNGNTTITAPIPVGDYQFVQWSDGVTTQTRSITQTVNLSYTLRDNANFTRTSNSSTFTFDNSLQNVTLGNDLNLCFGNTLQLQTTSPSITSYQWSNGATTPSITLSTSDQYIVEVTNSNSCSKRDTIQVTIIGQSPTININFPPEFCQNEIASFSESSFVQNGEAIGTRLWNFGNNTNSSLSSGTFPNNIVGNYNGTLTVTSVGGCQSSQAFSYSVRPKPLASYTSPPLCDNVSGLFTNTSSAPSSSIATSQWLVNDILNASTTNLNYAHPSTGIYNLKLVVANGFGCRDTSSQTQSVINTYPIPTSPSLIDPFNTRTILSTEQIPFSWTSVADNYFYELQISTSSDFASILSNQSTSQTNLTTATNTGGTVFWRVKANNPCLLGGTSPVFSLQSVAVADSLRLWLRADRGTTLNGSTLSSWLDQSSNNLNATQATAANQPTFVASNPVLNGLSSVRFDGTNDVLNGGIIPEINNSSMSLFIIANGELQSSSIAAIFSINSASNGFYFARRPTLNKLGIYNNNTNITSNLNYSGSGYNFKLLGGIKQLQNSFTLKSNSIVDLVSTNAGIISGFTNSGYQIAAGNNTNFLKGDIAEVMVFTKALSTVEQAGIEKYLMDKYTKPVNIGPDITSNYGFCDFTLTSNAFFQSYIWSTGATTSSISINEPGIYWVEATDIFGRVTVDSVILTRPHYAQIQLNNQLICYNAPQTINATIPEGDYTFVQWNDGLTTPSRTQGQAQSLFYTLKDNQNCTKSSNTALISIDNALQNVRLGNDTSLCVGNTIQLAVTSPSIVNYSWNTGNTNPNQLIDTAGAYILTVSNANLCFKSDTININVFGYAPVLAFSVPSTVCLGSSFTYSESSAVSGATISSVLWNFGNSQTSNQSAGQFDYSQVGDFIGSLLVQSDNGCSTNAPFLVSVKSLPIASFTVPFLCSNTPSVITNTSTIAVNGGTINSQIWNVDNLQVATTYNLTYSFPSAGTYEVELIVENQFGCRDTATQLVNTQAAFTIPSATSLILPSDNISILANQPIDLVWNAIANNYFYVVEISTNQGFSIIDFSTTTTSPNLSFTPITSGTYYWRVKTNNACLQGGVSEVRTFTIVSVSNTTLWLRGDAGVTTVSGAVSQWNDQSGNGYNATQTTATTRPLISNSVQFNNLPVIRFDGTDDVLVGTTISNFQNDNMTMFVLNSGNSQSGNMAGLFTVGTISNGLFLTRSISTTQAFRVWTNNIAQLTSLTNSAPTSGYLPKIVTMSREVGVQGKLSVNGSQQAITTNAPFLAPFTNAAYQIGRAPGYSTLNGEIAEVIVYNRILTAVEQIQVQKYLMDKYAPPINLGADITSNYGFCDTILAPTNYFVNYLWSNGATSSTLSVNQPGTYWVRATDIFGRISSDTVQFVRPVYDSITLQDRIVCFNNLINETAYVPSGYSFVNWNDGNSNPTRLLNQNENISYTVADNRNCQITSNLISVTIDSSLYAISLGVDTNLCVGNSIELLQASSSITSYLWNTGNTNSIQTLDTAGVYILDVQNQNNCFNQDTIEITIDGFTPNIVFNFPFENCQFSEVLFSETSTVQGSTIASTSWTIGNQTPILNSNAQITFNQPGIVPVRLEVVSAQNCRSIDTFSIIVHPKPIVNFTTINYCPYQNIEFNPINLAISQLTSYDWNFGQSSSSSNTSQLANPSHFYGQEGTYSVNLKVVDEYGCIDTLIQDVLIQPAPISSFSVQNTCENTFVEFTNASSILSGYSIASNIWSYGDNTSAINPTVGKGYANFGDYTIELIVVGNNGCSDTSSNSITIYPNPVLNWSITPSCKNTLTVFEDLSSIPEGTLVSTDWLVNLQYPFTTPVASYRFATLGAQYLNLTSTSDKNCTSDTLIIVNVNPELNANFNYSPANVVAGVPVIFTDLSIGSSIATWDLGIGEELITYTPPLNQFAKTYPLEWVDSTVDVTLFVENQIGCKDTLTKSFGVQNPAFDLEVKSIFIQEINGFNTIGVEFENKGTIAITSIDFQLASLNSNPIQETWTGNLLANQDLIYMFNAKLSAYNSTQDDLTDFVCVEGFASDNLGNVDLVLGNNKVCQNLENESIALISVAPNPTEALTNVSLFIPASSEPSKLNVSLYNMSGEIVQYVIDNQVIEQGIFDFNVDFSNLSRGIYLLKIEDGTSSKVIRLSKI
jgi:PKD repeat protein